MLGGSSQSTEDSCCTVAYSRPAPGNGMVRSALRNVFYRFRLVVIERADTIRDTTVGEWRRTKPSASCMRSPIV